MSDSRATLTTFWTGTSTVTMPMEEISRVVALDGTPGRTKLPLMSVTTPIEVPFTTTEAPMAGDPSSARVILPVTVRFWAKSTPPTVRRRLATNNRIFFPIV